MSTRGLMGFKKNGKVKAQYNHFDSYVSYLGKNIIDTINNIPKEERINVLNKAYDNIILVNENKKPTQEIIDYCIKNNVCDLSVSTQSINDMYCLLRGVQGNLQVYLDGFKYMIDNESFINDTLFCEYAYIIDLDNNTLNITFGWENRHTIQYDLLNLNYSEIEEEISSLESV